MRKMRFLLLLLAFSYATINVEGQNSTIEIIGKDGSVQHFNWNDINHIEFNTDNTFCLKSIDGTSILLGDNVEGIAFCCSADAEISSPIGEWEFVSINGMTEWDETTSDLLPGDRIQICSNGRVYDKWDEIAVWKEGGPYALSDSEADLVYFKIKIWELSESTFNFDLTLHGMTANIVLNRVSNDDRTDNPYTFDNSDPTLDVDYTFFTPCFDFGCSMDEVKSFMEGTEWILKDGNDTHELTYQDESDTRKITYIFSKEQYWGASDYYATYNEELLESIISKIKNVYGVTLEESASFRNGGVQYLYTGQSTINGNPLYIYVITNKNSSIMISYNS